MSFCNEVNRKAFIVISRLSDDDIVHPIMRPEIAVDPFDRLRPHLSLGFVGICPITHHFRKMLGTERMAFGIIKTGKKEFGRTGRQTIQRLSVAFFYFMRLSLILSDASIAESP